MQKYRMVLLVGGLLIGAASAATAQQLATAVPAPKSGFMVFTEAGSHALSPTAIATIRAAVRKADATRTVVLTGRPENVATVKSELMRQGIPDEAIVTRNEARAPLPRPQDGLSNPLDRRVEIRI